MSNHMPVDVAGPLLRKTTTLLSIVIASGITFVWHEKAPPESAVDWFAVPAIFLALPTLFATRGACSNARKKTIATDLMAILGTIGTLFLVWLLNKQEGGASGPSGAQWIGLLILVGFLYIGLPILIIREFILLFLGPSSRILFSLLFIIIIAPILLFLSVNDSTGTGLVSPVVTAVSLSVICIRLSWLTRQTPKPRRVIDNTPA